ncbi:uncharacterized protein LOC121014273 [Herpailurus yagouaroundi]|uniref:uncharacterized protein LOC121014273 n=1 Tax=Herpailurus yagouaroundi TaxID=1608482 RepID=UPI001AD62B19|nr:uncharacterized protein LOC121014273 [Puma yagouaroundi]
MKIGNPLSPRHGRFEMEEKGRSVRVSSARAGAPPLAPSATLPRLCLYGASPDECSLGEFCGLTTEKSPLVAPGVHAAGLALAGTGLPIAAGRPERAWPELQGTDCVLPGGRPWDQAWSVRSAGAQAKGFKRERGCLLLPRPCRWGRGGCLARPLQLCAPTAAGRCSAPLSAPGGRWRAAEAAQILAAAPAPARECHCRPLGERRPHLGLGLFPDVPAAGATIRAPPGDCNAAGGPGTGPPKRLGAFLRTFKGTPVPVEASFFPPPGRASSVNLQDPKAIQ